MPINHWLSPYMMEASAKTSLPTTTAAAVCCGQSTAFGLNLNNEDEEAEADSGCLPREPLFEKPLTPSDVGKLNRLVIPKQHAERHFPLNGGESGGGEKGLLLGFEDEVGKSWRFRYSYWNSSQSYVLTKGWSRFVKEKRLDAGDIVLFARHPKDVDRLFIGWRRRGGQEGGGVPQQPSGGGWSRLLYAAHPYPTHSSNSVFYQSHSCPHAENENENEGREKNGNSKRLRLFGVNLVEWDDDESDPKPKVVSSQGGRSIEEEPYHEHYSSRGRSVSYVCDSTNHI